MQVFSKVQEVMTVTNNHMWLIKLYEFVYTKDNCLCLKHLIALLSNATIVYYLLKAYIYMRIITFVTG